jgi:hypothetical protein
VFRDPVDAMVSMYRFFDGWFMEAGSVPLGEFADYYLERDGFWLRPFPRLYHRKRRLLLDLKMFVHRLRVPPSRTFTQFDFHAVRGFSRS